MPQTSAAASTPPPRACSGAKQSCTPSSATCAAGSRGEDPVDHVRERLAAERLHHHDRRRPGDHVVAADEVRVGQPAQKPALGDQPVRARPDRGLIRAHRLEHDAAVARVAPGVVDVEHGAARHVLDHLAVVADARADRKRAAARALARPAAVGARVAARDGRQGTHRTRPAGASSGAGSGSSRGPASVLPSGRSIRNSSSAPPPSPRSACTSAA